MSEEESSFWLSLTEKLVGLILIILSVLLFYFTATSSALSVFTGLFAFLGVIILISGTFLIVVKPPE